MRLGRGQLEEERACAPCSDRVPLLLEELDLGNDGTVDGWRVIDRSDAGAILRETSTGTMAGGHDFTKIYDYCQ